MVDTVGFNDKFWFDMAGHPHTTQLHVIERYHRRDFGNLEIQNHHRRSAAPTRSRGSSIAFPRSKPQMEMTEYVCNENNSDVLHLVGK